MSTYISLIGSKAEPLGEDTIKISGERFVTFTGNYDLDHCNKLKKRLSALESAFELDLEELNAIKEDTKEILFLDEEIDEILVRIKYLKRLHDIKEQIYAKSVKTQEDAKRLRTRLAPTKISPLKNKLIAELDKLIETLPNKQSEPSKLSFEQELIENAKKEIGDTFIKLGDVRQRLIVECAIHQYRKKVDVEKIHQVLKDIEQDVQNLADEAEPNELINKLEKLPLSYFSTLPSSRKIQIAKKLIEMNAYNSYASLDRMIVLLDRQITVTERKQEPKTEHMVQLNDGKDVMIIKVWKNGSEMVKIIDEDKGEHTL